MKSSPLSSNGINAYIKALGGTRPLEFKMAGYDPGLWAPEDCLSRVAGLLMTHNLTHEVKLAGQVRRFGIPSVEKFFSLDPPIPIAVPNGLDLAEITHDIVRVYEQAVGPVAFSTEQGSNNWVVDGTMTVTGKPLLANDPHRPVQIPVAAQDRSSVRARLECDRGGRAGAAGHRTRAQRSHRVRLHHRRDRPAGSLRREAKPCQPR